MEGREPEQWGGQALGQSVRDRGNGTVALAEAASWSGLGEEIK